MPQSYAENQTVAGYFEDHESAQQALDQLRDAGFTSAHLGVAHRGGSARTTDAKHSGEHVGVWDKVKNFFEGGVEPYAEERTRGDLATREITTTGTDPNAYGSNANAYDHDDLDHSLRGLSVPEERSRHLAQRFRSGENSAVVTVNAGDRADEAERILRDNGADLGDNAAEYGNQPQGGYANDTNPPLGGYQGETQAAYGTEGTQGDFGQRQGGFAGEPQGSVPTGPSADGDVQDLQNVQLLGEVLRVHKDRVERGEVRVRKDIITETQTVQVPVTREELVVERVPVDQNTQPAGAVGEGQEIRIPLTEETASIDKGTVVRDQVAVGKRPVSEVRDLSAEVRREELVVDDEATRKRA